MKRIVIVGATSAMARHCARLWVEAAAADVTLIGRDVASLEGIAADLRVRSPASKVTVARAGFLTAAEVDEAVKMAVAPCAADIVLIAHGSLPVQRDCEASLAACEDALLVNGLSPVLFAEAFAGHMIRAGHGTLVLLGSVAGDRGRKSNYVYGSAKGLLARYAQGLQHRFHGTRVRVVLVKPGPTDTPMTAHLKSQGASLASVEDVARQIVKAVEKGSRVAYVPAKWQLIMLVIRHLPHFVFGRLNI